MIEQHELENLWGRVEVARATLIGRIERKRIPLTESHSMRSFGRFAAEAKGCIDSISDANRGFAVLDDAACIEALLLDAVQQCERLAEGAESNLS